MGNNSYRNYSHRNNSEQIRTNTVAVNGHQGNETSMIPQQYMQAEPSSVDVAGKRRSRSGDSDPDRPTTPKRKS